MIERQELYCHYCDGYVRFDIDPTLNGEHIITCPNCGHQHYRYVQDGIITDERWQSNNMVVIQYTSTNVTYGNVSVDTSSTASSSFTNQLWLNMTSSGGTGW